MGKKMMETERPVKLSGEFKEFEGLMEEVATLEPKQQEHLNLFLRGYVTCAAYNNAKNKAAIG